jgi:hypothetical protein
VSSSCATAGRRWGSSRRDFPGCRRRAPSSRPASRSPRARRRRAATSPRSTSRAAIHTGCRPDRAWLLAERFGDETPFDAPDDNLELAFEFLGGLRRDLPPGTFVFVLSDFLVTPAPGAWSAAVAHGWDVVPVVVQDPVWERSFPPVGGVTVPVADPRSGRVSLVRFTARSAEQRRLANEERWQALLTELRAVGLDPVELASATPDEVDRTFVTWAEARRLGRWEH